MLRSGVPQRPSSGTWNQDLLSGWRALRKRGKLLERLQQGFNFFHEEMGTWAEKISSLFTPRRMAHYLRQYINGESVLLRIGQE